MRLSWNCLPLFSLIMSVSIVFSDFWPYQKGLRICHLNINHILKKLNEISHILFSINLDIFVLRNSRLNGNIDNDEFQIPGYLAEGRDSFYIHHTGLCVNIKNDLQCLR